MSDYIKSKYKKDIEFSVNKNFSYITKIQLDKSKFNNYSDNEKLDFIISNSKAWGGTVYTDENIKLQYRTFSKLKSIITELVELKLRKELMN